jgi:predicted Zn-dependent protease
VKPAHELYAEALLEDGKPQEAIKQFQLSLAREPKRMLSLRGLAKAQTAAGDATSAQRTSAELKAFWQDAPLP